MLISRRELRGNPKNRIIGSDIFYINIFTTGQPAVFNFTAGFYLWK